MSSVKFHIIFYLEYFSIEQVKYQGTETSASHAEVMGTGPKIT